jgi:hypothetical protein
VAPPPLFKSPEYKEQIEKLRAIVAQHIPTQQTSTILLTTGPGTKTLAGFWQDELWEAYKTTSSTSSSLHTDLEFAFMQKILAEALADTLIECWHIKFTYWTARPDMVIEDLKPVLPTPSSPSYVSDQAATSRAAAEILGAFFPTQKNEFVSEAELIKDATVWEGFNFTIDAEEGFKLGEQLGKEVVNHLNTVE